MILKAHPFSLAATEVFLRHRGWQVYSTNNIKEALLQLVQKKYSYVLLSVDHSNKKTPMLPQLIRHKFNTVVITFAETHSTLSYNRLNASMNPLKIYAPVTGPAVERCITKYLRNLRAKMQPHPDDIVYRKPEHIAKGPATAFLKGQRRLGRVQTFGGNPTSPGQIKTREDLPQDPGHVNAGIGATAESGQVTTSTSDLASAGQVQATALLPIEPGQVQSQEGTSVVSRRQSKKKPADVEYQQRHFLKKKKRSDALDSLIVRGTQLSLLGNVEFLDGTVQQKVENTTHSGCIIVESERFSGYIVAALGQDHPLEDTFLKNVKKTLFKYLKDNGEHVTESEALSLKIKTVDFEPWALEYADFLRTSVHKGDEIAVAFFPRRPVNIHLDNSLHRDLATIRLLDLKGDREVNFDLFLHLKANDKFILYTPKGGIFYQKQLERLKNQGITHLHVPKKAAEAVTQYHAENYLNDLVAAFDENEISEQSV